MLANSDVFDPVSVPCDDNYFVDRFMKLGYRNTLIAKQGSGKSYFGEYLAVCTVFDKPFMGLKVKGGDAMIVDQDTTASNVLDDRLARMYKSFDGEKSKYKLYRIYRQNLHIKDGSLTRVIKAYPNLTFVYLDSLRAFADFKLSDSTCGRELSNFYQSLPATVTVLLSCHISGHKEYSPDDLMTVSGDKLDNFSMDSTHIVSTCDMAYFAAGVKKQTYNMLDALYVRPHSRRSVIPLNPFSTQFIEGEANSITFGPVKELDYSQYMSEDAKRLLEFIWNLDDSKQFTIRTLINVTDDLFKPDQIRELCKELERLGCIEFGHFGEHGTKYYRLTSAGGVILK